MALTPFDKRLLADGLAFFDRPRLATLLEQLGDSYFERVDTLATMLRHCPPDELDEIADIFDRALTRATRDRIRTRDEDRDRGRTREEREGTRSRVGSDPSAADEARRRYSASAERREQRRRSS